MNKLAQENIRLAKAQHQRVSKPIGSFRRPGEVRETEVKMTRNQLGVFLNGLVIRHIPEGVNMSISFDATAHFCERLLFDRADNFDKQWVSLFFSRLFQNQKAEFLFTLALTDIDKNERLVISMDGKSIAIDKVLDPFCSNGGWLLKLVTIYKGKAQSPHFTTRRMEIRT